ncbi:N-acetylgalactosamine kinase [Halotydeus destructor]|nr:N-acetylgalactosamine kinase [Halotydeus destructor]
MSDENFVPILEINSKVLTNDRISQTINHFKASFNKSPKFVVRVPGRVNLIGEHIDYCGYAVFPMAVEKDIVIAIDTNTEGKLNLTNIQKDLYDDFSCNAVQYEIAHPPKWNDYFLCGYKGVVEQGKSNGHLNSNLNENNNSLGLDIAVLGSLPPSSGLSSSSALVCGAAVATSYALYRKPISKTSMANLCAESERFIGTQGGGMDQAIAFLAQEGSAKMIEFVPTLKANNVILPEGANFFISHCGVSCNKGATDCFNIRVLETKAAAAILALRLAKVTGDENLSTMQNFTLGAVQTKSGKTLEEMLIFVSQALKDVPYSTEDLLRELNVTSEDELMEALAPSKQDVWVRFKRALTAGASKGFLLQQRALHVYSEASRVLAFRKVCESSAPNQDKIESLGKLMDESHSSCRDVFDCSCAELDQLVATAKKAGAKGSRLTGAGWGGCAVSLVADSECGQFEKAMEEYSKLTKSFTLMSKPGSGIQIFLHE